MIAAFKFIFHPAIVNNCLLSKQQSLKLVLTSLEYSTSSFFEKKTLKLLFSERQTFYLIGCKRFCHLFVSRKVLFVYKNIETLKYINSESQVFLFNVKKV
jgi:hypothetical protein